LKKLITSKNHISQYFPLELKFRVFPRTVFLGNYHWYFPANPIIEFIPEILNILSKCNLSDFFTNYTKNADFPEKPHWKHIVVNAVNQKHDNDWQTCINLDHDFNQFREIHISISIASVWKFPTNCSKFTLLRLSLFHLYQIMINHVKFANVCVKTSLVLVVQVPQSEMCSIWWDLLIEKFPLDLYAELSECEEVSLFRILLRKDPS
jgi:hypothetical protein